MSASDDVTRLAEELAAKGEPFVFATVVRTVASVAAKPGAKAILTADGRMVGWVGGGCALGAVKKAARRCLDDGEARLVSVMPFDQLKAQGLRPGDTRDGIEFDKNMCPSRGVVDVFIEPVLPQPQVILCGATPVALAIAELAPRVGLKVAIHAPADGFEDVAKAAVTSFVVVATQGSGDEDALMAALRSSARYVAFVGSKAKVAALKESLAEKGIPAERLAELHGPAGIPIGAVTPEEIALSILADIVQARRRKGAAKSRMEAAE
ncbi:MAG TPA: XdhC family protein [Dongiaceae bacterium]|jgi:xanthine dehydrogenase accessory factor|nr:XdhC family protein [Dongiaceae bacterium]